MFIATVHIRHFAKTKKRNNGNKIHDYHVINENGSQNDTFFIIRYAKHWNQRQVSCNAEVSVKTTESSMKLSSRKTLLLLLIECTKRRTQFVVCVAETSNGNLVRFITYGAWVRNTASWCGGVRSVLHTDNEQVALPLWTSCSSLNYPSYYNSSFSPFWLAHFPTLLRNATSTLSPCGLRSQGRWK